MSALGQLPPHDVRRAVLDQFRPLVRYDSHEAFYADAVSEMLTDPVVELRRANGTVIATPGAGPESLAEAFFTATGYANHESYAPGDHIAFTAKDYRVQAREQRAKPGIPDIVYGHFAWSLTDQHHWLQYWYFMLYNDAQLIGSFGLHEGDWEMVQLRLRGASPDWEHPAIDQAVYAQHNYAEKLEWARVEKYEQTIPIAYSALGSHAHYFGAGIFKTAALWDVADGEGHAVRQTLVYLDEEPPGWLSWKGKWGGTEPGIPDIESSSPTGPAQHREWDDPGRFAQTAKPAIAVKSLPGGQVRISRSLRNYPTVDFDFEQFDDPALYPGALVVEIHPPNGHTGTFTLGIDQLIVGSLTLRYALDPSLVYGVTVTWVAADNRRTQLSQGTIAQLPEELPPGWLRRLLSALRWALQRVTHPTR